MQRKLLIGLYSLISIIALFLCWQENLTYSGFGIEGLWMFIVDTQANPAARSVTYDLFFFFIAASFFMWREGKQLGMKFVWAYIVLGFVIAISVTFPLFLIHRELKKASI